MNQTPSSAIELTELISRAVHGDSKSRDELFARVEKRLMSLTQRMLRSYPRLKRWEETADVFQNAVLRLYLSLEGARPESAKQFFGLAATQIRRTLLDACKHHFGRLGNGGRHGQHASESPDVYGDRVREDGRFDGQAKADDTAGSWECWMRFHESIELLPDDQREVFELVWYGGSSFGEAAELLDIAKRTVIRRIQRARENIITALDGEFPSLDG